MIAIIDYKAGNAPSVMHAARYLNINAKPVCRADDIAGSSHIILPGVGNAEATMQSLRETGMLDAIEEAVLHRGVFFLGICVGLQILFEHSDEGDTDCLGWIKGRVVRFDDKKLRVPQIGWNKVSFVKETPVNPADDYFYFVNSYHAQPYNADDIWGIAGYGGDFTAAVMRDNIYAAQFHVEKSGNAGLAILYNFCNQ